MYTKLKREGRVREHPEYGHQLSDSMLSRIHAMLHQRYERCGRAAHLIARNPTEGTVVPKPNYRPKANPERGAVGHFHGRRSNRMKSGGTSSTPN